MVRADRRRDCGGTSDQGLVTRQEGSPHAGRFRGTGVARAAQARPRSALILKATRGPWFETRAARAPHHEVFETRPCGPLLTMREWVWRTKKGAALLRPHPEERGRRPRVSKDGRRARVRAAHGSRRGPAGRSSPSRRGWGGRKK